MRITITAPKGHHEQALRVLLRFMKDSPDWPINNYRRCPAVNDAGDIWLCWRTRTGWHVEFISAEEYKRRKELVEVTP